MRFRTGMIGAALLALTAVGTAGVVTSVAAVESEPPSGDYLRWKTLNGNGNKHFQVFTGDGTPVSDKQDYTGGSPWTLAEEPELVTVSAEGGVPVHFGGRQRHGVASGDEKGSARDTISGDEVLIISAGEDLGQLFSGFTDLRAQAGRDGATVRATATFNDATVAETTFAVGDRELLEITWDLGGLSADAFEFSVDAGSFGFKGFKTTNGQFPQFDLATDLFAVEPGKPAQTPFDRPNGNEVIVTTECKPTGEGTTTCDDKEGGVPITQSVFEREDGIILDINPLDTGGPEVVLRTTVVIEYSVGEFDSGAFPAPPQVDFNIAPPDEFGPLLSCGAIGTPSSGGTPACLVSVFGDTSADPYVYTYVIDLAADPRWRF